MNAKEPARPPIREAPASPSEAGRGVVTRVAYFDAEGDPVDVDEYVHQYGERWLVARWDERANQYTAPLTKNGRRGTGCHSIFSRTLGYIASSPNVYCYTSRGSAVSAALLIYGWEKERRCATP
jgi:hypothetical protein